MITRKVTSRPADLHQNKTRHVVPVQRHVHGHNHHDYLECKTRLLPLKALAALDWLVPQSRHRVTRSLPVGAKLTMPVELRPMGLIQSLGVTLRLLEACGSLTTHVGSARLNMT